MPLEALPRPMLIAHRGASALAPESTKAAIQTALQTKAKMVELDVQMTKDGRLVIFHDNRLKRTTNGKGWLSKTPYNRLRHLDAGSWFSSKFSGQKILTPEEVLRLVPHRVMVNLELKKTARRSLLLKQVQGFLRLHKNDRARLLVSSFDARLLRPLTESGVDLALICRWQADQSLRKAIRLGCTCWHPFYRLVTRKRLARAHQAGLRVHAWTIDTVKQARNLLRIGVDGIFTNNPKYLQTYFP